MKGQTKCNIPVDQTRGHRKKSHICGDKTQVWVWWTGERGRWIVRDTFTLRQLHHFFLSAHEGICSTRLTYLIALRSGASVRPLEFRKWVVSSSGEAPCKWGLCLLSSFAWVVWGRTEKRRSLSMYRVLFAQLTHPKSVSSSLRPWILQKSRPTIKDAFCINFLLSSCQI